MNKSYTGTLTTLNAALLAASAPQGEPQVVAPEEVGPLSGKPATERQGPLRRQPMYYAGQTMGKRKRTKNGKRGGRPLVHADTERKADGTYGIKNKAARRMIREKQRKHHSKVERGVKFAQAIHAEARTLSNNSHDAKRIYDQELAFHQPVPEPLPAATEKEIVNDVAAGVYGKKEDAE